jgi:DNA-binding response OmpR family regulator
MANILIVDDDTELAAGLSGVLTSEGFTVATIDNLADAKDTLLREQPDLLILDIMFPENPAGGFDLARWVRSNADKKELPIILLTAVNQELPMDFSASDIHDEWMPVQDFVEKPPEIPQLLAKIGKILA